MIQEIKINEDHEIICFRLLNSEIGNDHSWKNYSDTFSVQRFRLLNSEIGNDLYTDSTNNFVPLEFSSP